MRIDLGNDYNLRRFLYGDAIALAKHGNNYKIARNLRDSFPHPYTVEHARAWIQHVKEHESDTRFIISHEEEAIGEIGFVRQLDVHRFAAEIGYWMSEDHWGKGVGSRALSEVSRYAFEKHGLVRLFADVAEHNVGSCRILEKCGFQLEAVFRNHIYKEDQFYNQYVYGLIK